MLVILAQFAPIPLPPGRPLSIQCGIATHAAAFFITDALNHGPEAAALLSLEVFPFSEYGNVLIAKENTQVNQLPDVGAKEYHLINLMLHRTYPTLASIPVGRLGHVHMKLT